LYGTADFIYYGEVDEGIRTTTFMGWGATVVSIAIYNVLLFNIFFFPQKCYLCDDLKFKFSRLVEQFQSNFRKLLFPCQMTVHGIIL